MYVPERGDLVWLEFDPQAGHEQAGRRPALVLSPSRYNERSGLMLCCPITTRIKGYPFEIVLPEGLVTKGAILSDQIRSLDWSARRAKFIASVPTTLMQDVLARTRKLLS